MFLDVNLDMGKASHISPSSSFFVFIPLPELTFPLVYVEVNSPETENSDLFSCCCLTEYNNRYHI